VDVSVVILSFNGIGYLRECLASLFECTSGIEFEVIVVDNASTDGSPEMVEREFPQVRLLRRSTNAGFAVAANEGIRLATGEAVMLLNSDTRLTSNALPPMAAYLRTHPDVAVLGPRLIDPDGSLQYSCRRFPDFSVVLFNRYSVLTRLLPGNRFSAGYLMSDFDHRSIREVDWVSGAAVMLARHALDRIGLLDEAYFFYIEDVDLCQRAHRAGYKVVYFPEAELIHHIGKSSGGIPNRLVIERHRSMWHYYKKYLRRNPPLDLVTGLGIAGRCLFLLGLNNATRALARVRRAAP